MIVNTILVNQLLYSVKLSSLMTHPIIPCTLYLIWLFSLFLQIPMLFVWGVVGAPHSRCIHARTHEAALEEFPCDWPPRLDQPTGRQEEQTLSSSSDFGSTRSLSPEREEKNWAMRWPDVVSWFACTYTAFK